MRHIVEPMIKPNATLALRGFFWAVITIAAIAIAAAVVGFLILLALFLEKHQAGISADAINYAMAGVVIYGVEEVPVDVHLTEDANTAGGNR